MSLPGRSVVAAWRTEDGMRKMQWHTRRRAAEEILKSIFTRIALGPAG